MNATLVNDWYLTTDTGGSMGTTDTSGITSKQQHNATKVYTYFNDLGWSLSAIAGMLGNMQAESWLSPAYIQRTHRSSLPNSAANLSDVPNSTMLSFYDPDNRTYGIGLVQWDGKTNSSPVGQKLVSFAERYNLTWYEGDTQTFRIKREKEENIQWIAKTISGTTWNWSNYITNTETPEASAEIWRRCYERGGDDSIAIRKENARYWYDYFSGSTPSTGDWVSGETFAGYALSYEGQYLPYSQYDCIGFVNLVWQDIPIVSQNGWSLTNGTNSLWRSTRTFNTTDPNNNNPTNELWYKDTIANCISQYGGIPTGALLFHQIAEDGDPPIPDQYRGDGIGNFAHVGIYCGNDEVMQSGGRDSSSVPGGGVHKSTYDSSAWNYVAFVVYVDSTSSGGGGGGGDEGMPYWQQLLLMYQRRTKRYVKRVI